MCYGKDMPGSDALKLFSLPFYAMGSACILHLYARPEEGNRIARNAVSEVLRIEARYSRYRADSVLSEINRAAGNGGSIAVDEETARLLDYAYSCYQKSGKLFDITSGILRKAWDFSSGRLPEQQAIDELLRFVGMDKIVWEPPRLTFTAPGLELDLGGIGKEYAADRAAEICRGHGIEHGLVNLGGDIHVIGPGPSGQPWLIDINHPRMPETSIASIAIERGSLATSGDYERYMEVNGKRYCHILSPLTGWPVSGLSSVSVAAGQCLVAGSISTMAMLKGKEGIHWLTNINAPHIWMDEDGNKGGTMPSPISF